MEFTSVYELKHAFYAFIVLYDLLYERTLEQSISHKKMPTIEEHKEFVASHPYREWHLICIDALIVGAIYLTKNNEIGIGILEHSKGHGYGKQAVKMLIDMHQGERLLANINPANEASIKMFEGLGFKLIQQTYELNT